MNEIVLSEQFTVPTNEDVVAQVYKIAGQVKEGELNPLRALGLLAALEKVAKTTRELIMDSAITEAEKYPEKQIEMYGAKFERAESGVKYIFDGIEKYDKQKLKCDKENAKLKGIEKELKLQGMCGKESKTIVKVTLK